MGSKFFVSKLIFITIISGLSTHALQRDAGSDIGRRDWVFPASSCRYKQWLFPDLTRDPTRKWVRLVLYSFEGWDVCNEEFFQGILDYLQERSKAEPSWVTFEGVTRKTRRLASQPVNGVEQCIAQLVVLNEDIINILPALRCARPVARLPHPCVCSPDL